jgi:site-specific DNA recombinase
MKRRTDLPPTPPPVIRCAIYTRKSTDEGMDQEFNSLVAQREAAEAFILSQREQGWRVVLDHYDDPGFSGGSIERPALKRLLADVEARRVDCVMVYKVDRLSRSLLDFASIIGQLDRNGVTFVSVTQQFNTNTSLGRLTLNILLSFAQFEREIIGERTRDKVYAARRKGKWTGGHPVLGYDIDARGGSIHVNPEEAPIVRQIFQIFVRKRSLIETLYAVERKGWKAKSWITRRGASYGGRKFNRHTLEYLLRNPIYVGKVRLKGGLHAGEHPAIVTEKLWEQARQILQETERPSRALTHQPQNAVLRGLLFCGSCGTPMVPTYTLRKRTRVRYYTCSSAQKHGWKTCPTRTLAAGAIEEAVRDRVPADPANGLSLSDLIERITYDGTNSQVRITLRESHTQSGGPIA